MCMKMCLTAVLLMSFALSVQCKFTVMSDVESNGIYCSANQTSCQQSCCPHKNAVCCASELACCPSDMICIQNTCVGIQAKNGHFSLYSKKATPLDHVVESCPAFATECQGKCCPLSDATCCSDGLHCCPNGFTCDLKDGTCIRNISAADLSQKVLHQSASIFGGSWHKVCPGGNLHCPLHKRCCTNDKGEMDCCPQPLNLPPAQNNCCKTMYGFKCCYGDKPFCSYYGCF